MGGNYIFKLWVLWEIFFSLIRQFVRIFYLFHRLSVQPLPLSLLTYFSEKLRQEIRFNADIFLPNSFRTVENLWRITEELNILYKDNWTALADREIANFQTELLASTLANNEEQVILTKGCKSIKLKCRFYSQQPST